MKSNVTKEQMSVIVQEMSAELGRDIVAGCTPPESKKQG
jgi:hypothetical protein